MTTDFFKTHDALRLSNQLEEIFLFYVEGEDFINLSGEDRGDLTKNVCDLINEIRGFKVE